MGVGIRVKVIIGIFCTLAMGFIGFRILKIEPPETEVIYKTVKPEDRRITTVPFVENVPEPVTDIQQEADIESPEIETTPAPKRVPTAESDDAEIREFQAWLSSIFEQEDPLEETEQVDLKVETDEVDYDLERAVIESVIANRWENSLETYDIEGYMSAIWEDEFFYVSDVGTPDNPDDDMIFRGGQQEREGTLKMFAQTQNINLNLYKRGDIEFLSETLAMVDYDYDLRLHYTQHGEGNPSGRMIFINLRAGDPIFR